MNVKYHKQNLREVLVVDSVITIHYFEFTKDFKHDGELHPFWEFVYIDKGEIEVTADNKVFLLKKDEVLFHKPNEFHKIVCNGEIAPNVIIISFGTESKSMKFFQNKILHLSIEQKKMLAKILKEGMSSFVGPFDIPFRPKIYKNKKAPFGSEQKFKNLLELFLIELINENSSTAKSKRLLNPAANSGAYGIIGEIVEFLENDLTNTYTLDDLSDKFSISKSTLKHIFRTYKGKPLIHYHIDLKIAEAKRLIREEKHSITRISQMLGFSSVHYFSRCFKKNTRMSPTHYMSTLKAKLEV
jgi:AraC-like DNA-binding protein/quercetin dioxygenase-like cupin family protein